MRPLRRPHPVLPLTLLALLLPLGCGTLSPLEVPGEAGCTSDDECKGDRLCVEGRCVFSDWRPDAGPDGGSDDGGLDAGTDGGTDGGVDGGSDGGVDAGSDGGPAPGELGGACERRLDCELPGSVCLQAMPDGYCALRGCLDCPAGGACVVTDAGQELCLQGCNDTLDCRAGYTCSTALGEAACLPTPGGGDSPVGGPCTSSAECAGQPSFCIEEWPDGYCIHAACDACPEGSACVQDADFAACMATCTDDSGCRAGYRCLAFQGQNICFAVQ